MKNTKLWFFAGMISALTLGAFANLPSSGGVSGSLAPEADVSEIKAKRQAELSFDQDLKALSHLQGRYRENIPLRGHKANGVERIRSSQSAPRRVAPKKVRGKASSMRASAPRAKVSLR